MSADGTLPLSSALAGDGAVDGLTKTTCPYCGVGCGVLAAADGTIKGDPDHPANYGRLCSKGSALGDTISLEGRLLAPKMGGQDATWDAALGAVAEKFSAAIAEHGPDSVAFYVSGQLLTEDYYVANKLMKGYIGSANIDTNSRLCMASSVVGHRRAFGTDTVPGTYEDLEEADLLVLVGSNLAWCHPVLYQRVAAAKAARPGMKVVNIDPRRTATSDLADMHLRIAGDGDVALFNGLLVHLAEQGAVDGGYIGGHVDGFDAALDAASNADLTDTGLSHAEISAFYDLFTRTDKVVTIYSQGVNQSSSGSDKVNAILNCHLATGRIGRPGMGPFSVTGQPNAMGGREVGGLANMLGWHLDLENAEHRDLVQAAWDAPVMAPKPGLKAVDLFNACESGQIKALWVMSTNPAVSLPEADRVTRAIQKVPFVVVSDILERTDTGDIADVLLPAAAWGEKSGTVTNSERRISRQRAFMPMPGQVRPDWEIICDVARRMGFDQPFDFADEAAVFDEYARLSALARDAGRDFDITGLAGLSRDAYDGLEPVQWPVPEVGEAGGRFFGKGGFFHAGGRAKMLPIQAPEVDRSGLRLNTGRIRDQWHTMTRTGRSAKLSQHLAEPYVEVHPADARDYGLEGASLARLSNELGQAILRVVVTDRVGQGTVFAPMHWTRQMAPAGRSNPLVTAKLDPFSGQPALKGARVEIEPFKAAWYAYVASTTDVSLGSPYAARAKTTTGWQAELAGDLDVTDWSAFAQEVTGLSDAQVTVFSDPARNLARVALHDGDTLVGVLFAAPEPVAVARAHVVGLIGSETSAQVALAGRPSADMPDPGPVVCSCFGVGVNTIRRAVAGGCASVDALGEATQAGTNCGSCRPELAALIAAQKQVAAE